MSDLTESSVNAEISLEACVEALLFVASGAVSVAQLAEVLDTTSDEIEKSLITIESWYRTRGGLRLQYYSGRIQLTTAPELAKVIEKYLGLEATARLSRAALETLAIIAYRQPVTRPGIDVVRGVNSDGVLRSLLSKGLIQESGRAEGPGRPILYVVTQEFLQHFGLSSLNELPPYDEEGADLNENSRLLKD